MSKTIFECRQVILKNWTQMNQGSETLTHGSQHRTIAHCAFAQILWPLYIPTIVVF